MMFSVKSKAQYLLAVSRNSGTFSAELASIIIVLAICLEKFPPLLERKLSFFNILHVNVQHEMKKVSMIPDAENKTL